MGPASARALHCIAVAPAGTASSALISLRLIPLPPLVRYAAGKLLVNLCIAPDNKANKVGVTEETTIITIR